MSTIISLQAKRLERAEKGHFEGPAHCMECGAKWVAMAPPDLAWLPCPGCGMAEGRFDAAVEIIACECGNTLFQLTMHGTCCAPCGVWFDL